MKRRKIKWRRNPKPSKENLNKEPSPYKDYLFWAILIGDPKTLSRALAYRSMGDECDECDECDRRFQFCQCEGKRAHEFDPITNTVIQGPCEQCNENYCICDYDIWKDNHLDDDKIRKVAFSEMVSTLNQNSIYSIICKLVTRLKNLTGFIFDDNKIKLIKQSKFLKKVNDSFDDAIKKGLKPSEFIKELHTLL